MKVRALQYMYYDRRERHIGEEYEMDDREEMTAKLLETLGKIAIVGPPRANLAPRLEPEKQSYHAAELSVEGDAALETAEGEEPIDGLTRRRYYRRRDMKAER